jgi:hypothetical protein
MRLLKIPSWYRVPDSSVISSYGFFLGFHLFLLGFDLSLTTNTAK